MSSKRVLDGILKAAKAAGMFGLKAAAKALVWAAIGAVAILLLWSFESRNKPELMPWHTASLKSEFSHWDKDRPVDLKGYLELEERLLTELKSKVAARGARGDNPGFNRFDPNSVSCPWNYPIDYNRTFEISPPEPRGGILLVHGLTDSPYSMRSIAETFAGEGLYVLALRLPGHGTAPSGLLSAGRKDWKEAFRLGARHVAQKAGGGPFYLGGYSTGGALAVQYCLDSIGDTSLPKPRRVFLFSPSIGITSFAAAANVLKTLSFIPYFEKSKWSEIYPEYDPYKYNSFPLSAANESYRLTSELKERLEAEAKAGRLGGFPAILAFQSLADATVNIKDTGMMLFRKLPAGEHEAVVFDVNRFDRLRPFIDDSVGGLITEADLKSSLPPYRLTVISNSGKDSMEVSAYRLEPGAAGAKVEPVGLSWPTGIFSLSHVAVPFPLDDPICGIEPSEGALHLGNLALRGERNAIVIPMQNLLRLRCNPFFTYMAGRMREAVKRDLAGGTPPPR